MRLMHLQTTSSPWWCLGRKHFASPASGAEVAPIFINQALTLLNVYLRQHMRQACVPLASTP
eukprot:m.6955 g.6955  ORF g.6955 m.6955 type:complete len:62 (-) comp2684_c0_seq1:16-201(-)